MLYGEIDAINTIIASNSTHNNVRFNNDACLLSKCEILNQILRVLDIMILKFFKFIIEFITYICFKLLKLNVIDIKKKKKKISINLLREKYYG